jgi:cell division cycle 20-like protein 1 (cofactor of APC complex)
LLNPPKRISQNSSKIGPNHINRKLFNFISPVSPHKKSNLQSHNHTMYSPLLNEVVESFPKIKTPRHPKCHKVLDAPEIGRKLYATLVDWSVNNFLAIGLNRKAYFLNNNNDEVVLFHDFQDKGPISSLGFDSKGERLLTATEQLKLNLWNFETRKHIRQCQNNVQKVTQVRWSDHNLVMTGAKDSRINFLDFRAADALVNTVKCHKAEICGLDWSTDFGKIVSGSIDGACYVWEHRNLSRPLLKFPEHIDIPQALSWSPHRKQQLAVGGGPRDPTVRVWDINSNKIVKTLNTTCQVTNVMWSPVTEELITSHGYPLTEHNQMDYAVALWSYPDFVLQYFLKGHDDSVFGMKMSPDNTTLATVAGDETLRFWDLYEQNPTKDLKFTGCLDKFERNMGKGVKRFR